MCFNCKSQRGNLTKNSNFTDNYSKITIGLKQF